MSQDGGAGRIKGTGPLPHSCLDRAWRSADSGERRDWVQKVGVEMWRGPAARDGKEVAVGKEGSAARLRGRGRWADGGVGPRGNCRVGAEAQGAGTRDESRVW